VVAYKQKGTEIKLYRPEEIVNVDELNLTLVANDEHFKVMRNYNKFDKDYLISNYGRLYSHKVNRFLCICADKNGYLRTKISQDGKRKTVAIHRLVGFAFVENYNPDKYNTINHKDENPSNPKWTNLEWCDDKYNLNYGTAQKRRSSQRAKKVYQYDLNNNFIDEYESLPDVKSKIGFNASIICKYCNNGQAYKGYYWRYAS